MPEDVKPEVTEVPVAPEPPKDSDTLADVKEPTADDAIEASKERAGDASPSKIQKVKHWVINNKKLSIPAVALLMVVIVFATPFTRYALVGLVYKKNYSVFLYDTTAGTPVSGALVSSGSVSAITDGGGRAQLKLPVGKHKISFSKKYYQDTSADFTVPILNQKTTPTIKLIATGRQVKITVKNVVSKQALANVGIAVSDILATTDKTGSATIVLPASLSLEKATLSLSGYNNQKVDVKISNTEVAKNEYTLTPSGKVYYLSNRTGSINIMKSNYDGTSQETAIAGTGSESLNTSQLVQSSDGKYVAYIAKRSGDTTPQLYILSASDDKLLGVDSGKANFSIVGWIGDNLIYTVVRNDISPWQNGQYKLKSYSAGTGKTTLLDQSSSTGDENSYAYEHYPFVGLMKNTILYTKDWTGYEAQESSLVEAKTFTIKSIEPSGTNSKTLTSFPALDSVQVNQSGPGGINIWQQEYSSSVSHFFSYQIGGSVNSIDALSTDKFYDGTYGYFLSQDSTRSLWSAPRDGKRSIIVGDSYSAGSLTIAELSDFAPYGWAGNDYVLLTKNNSELYIMLASGGESLKITDFQPTNIYY